MFHKHEILFLFFVADSSNENPYEDIELDSQCSQQSVPSSPGANTKVHKKHHKHEAKTGVS